MTDTLAWLKIYTSVEREPGDTQPAALAASRIVAHGLGLPEEHVGVILLAGVAMVRAGRETPVAHLELHGPTPALPVEDRLRRELSRLMLEDFGVRGDRVSFTCRGPDAPG